jgi:hypothetical protein
MIAARPSLHYLCGKCGEYLKAQDWTASIAPELKLELLGRHCGEEVRLLICLDLAGTLGKGCT